MLLGTTVNGKPSILRISFRRGDAEARITGLTTVNFISNSPFSQSYWIKAFVGIVSKYPKLKYDPFSMLKK